MPHVIIKMYAGRSDQLKRKLAQQVTAAVTSVLQLGEESVSVAIEDVTPRNCDEMVYKPDILTKPDTIYKKPGYQPG